MCKNQWEFQQICELSWKYNFHKLWNSASGIVHRKQEMISRCSLYMSLLTL